MGTTYTPVGTRERADWFTNRHAGVDGHLEGHVVMDGVDDAGEYQCVDGGLSINDIHGIPVVSSSAEAANHERRSRITALMVAVLLLCILHVLLGLVAVAIGVISSIQADVWLAHTISPIWSGIFFIITATLGFASIKAKTPYMAMCFTAFSIVSLVVAIISIQLLRLGLVNHTTDGHTFQKEKKDLLILIALGVTGGECLFSLVSAVISLRVLKHARAEAGKKREGMFHLQVLSQKEVVLVSKTSTGKQKITSV